MSSIRSRYEDARPFQGAEGGDPPFPGFRPRVIGSAAGVIHHTVQEGDRLDLLGRHYYNDDRRWWRLVDANPEILCGLDLVLMEDEKDEVGALLRPGMKGRVVRVPRSKE